jgi:hypothetical protein
MQTEKQRELLRAVKEVMSTPEGRKLLEAVETFFLGEGIIGSTDAVTNFNAGVASVVLWMRRIHRASPEDLSTFR